LLLPAIASLPALTIAMISAPKVINNFMLLFLCLIFSFESRAPWETRGYDFQSP
jgi:hypothetical protein